MLLTGVANREKSDFTPLITIHTNGRLEGLNPRTEPERGLVLEPSLDRTLKRDGHKRGIAMAAGVVVVGRGSRGE